jgi:hypothetical protein
LIIAARGSGRYDLGDEESTMRLAAFGVGMNTRDRGRSVDGVAAVIMADPRD